ncbi:sensor histidine kinase [Streptomyces sp. NPDC088745]|uniref:sensor histidine kinase n=1 Tax=Streptomyces sp. NPDC088745 TaxID=3365884 RepID=UPI00380FC18D
MRRRVPPWAVDASIVLLSAGEYLTVRSRVEPLVAATYVLAVAALVFRRKWPVAVTLVTVPAAASGYLWLAPLAALATAAATVPARLAVYGCAALMFFAAASPKSVAEARERTVDEWAATLIGPALFSIGPTAWGQLVRTRRELAARLRELQHSKEQERRLSVEMAVVEERARLAREMHDGVSHHVSLLSMEAHLLALEATDAEARSRAERIGELGGRAVDELRDVLGVLRGTGTRERLPRLSELPGLIEASGLTVQARCSVPAEHPGLTPDRELAVYRTVQEALTNAAKHAPGSRITVSVAVAVSAAESVSVSSGAAELCVDVVNSPPAREGGRVGGKERQGHGLVGLRERAVRLGGSMTAGQEPDGGFAVRVRLPLPAGHSADHPPGLPAARLADRAAGHTWAAPAAGSPTAPPPDRGAPRPVSTT